LPITETLGREKACNHANSNDGYIPSPDSVLPLVSEIILKSTIFLRLASVFTLVHCVAHTIRGVLSGPTHGNEEITVIETMKSHSFNFAGFLRTYWDFHVGYGFFLTVILLIQGLLFWNLAVLTKTNALAIRPILALFFFNFLGMAIVAWKYFSLGPVIIELIIAACFAAAFKTAAPSQ
jgi:hypothetical protein